MILTCRLPRVHIVFASRRASFQACHHQCLIASKEREPPRSSLRFLSLSSSPLRGTGRRTPWGLGPSVELDEDSSTVVDPLATEEVRGTNICGKWNAFEEGERGGGRRISSLLVCGDGDLSFSAGVATELAELGISLTATVLEDRERHHATYRNSRQHTAAVLSSSPSPLPKPPGSQESSNGHHEVVFGVDATDLASSFPGRTFDRVQFNFPHWRGKTNHRHNRALLSDFLRSAAGAVTSDDGIGEVRVALCEGQGGATTTTREEWKGSWKAAEFANEHGLLLADVFPYQADYDLSSHRGMDRGFTVGKVPKMYVFKKSSVTIAREFQLCCRHELHVNLPEEMGGDSRFSLEEIVNGDAVRQIIEAVVPDGIRVEVPMRKCLKPEETGSNCRVGVYLVVYAGERTPLTRAASDENRELVEKEIANYVPLRANRANRTVSRPFPYPLLAGLIDHYLSRGEGDN